MVKDLFEVDIVADLRCKTPRFYVYFVGKEDYHIMDWAGCNFRRIKAPNQPVKGFISIKEAVFWGRSYPIWKEKYPQVDGIGLHLGDRNERDPRVMFSGTDTGVDEPKFDILTQRQWEQLKQDYVDWKKDGKRHYCWEFV